MRIFEQCRAFLSSLGMSEGDVAVPAVCESILREMAAGLSEKAGSLKMLPTYIDLPPAPLPPNPVCVIDAGGTNFRVGLARFPASGPFQLDALVQTAMPGADHCLGKEAFFKTMADTVAETAARSERIGFCFSYPAEILPNRDGRLIRFVKEIKAPEVEGALIGKNLLAALGMHKPIVVLNDTVATLLAGKAAAGGKAYAGYVGFILGTGLNGSYVESCRHIAKLPGTSGRQIINTELGAFDKIARGDIDVALDADTANPGVNTFEKMLAGGYIGPLVLRTLKRGAQDGFLPSTVAAALDGLGIFSAKELNLFLNAPEGSNPLADVCRQSGGQTTGKCYGIALGLVTRAAKLSAAALAALCLKSGGGESPAAPICITAEGTTFQNLKHLRDLTYCHLHRYLTDERGVFFDLIAVKNATLKGAAIAGLTCP